MLEHPREPCGPAFNFSIITVLSAVVGGLSRVFFPEYAGDRASFVAAAKLLARTDNAEWTIGECDNFAVQFYDAFRCNLVHTLGLHTEGSTRAGWTLAIQPVERKVCRHSPLPLTAVQLSDLDNVETRPQWLKPVLSCLDGTDRLNADALYWGVRRLVRDLATDSDRSAIADAWLAGPDLRDRFDCDGQALPGDRMSGSGIRSTAGPIAVTTLEPWADDSGST